MELSERQRAARRADAIRHLWIFCNQLDLGSEVLFIVRASNQGVFPIREVSGDFADATGNYRPCRGQVFGDFPWEAGSRPPRIVKRRQKCNRSRAERPQLPARYITAYNHLLLGQSGGSDLDEQLLFERIADGPDQHELQTVDLLQRHRVTAKQPDDGIEVSPDLAAPQHIES